jgi:hypothetical protein
MNHTGLRDGARPAAAASSGGSVSAAGSTVIARKHIAQDTPGPLPLATRRAGLP